MSEHDYKATGYDTINLFRKQIKTAQPEIIQSGGFYYNTHSNAAKPKTQHTQLK